MLNLILTDHHDAYKKRFGPWLGLELGKFE